MNTNFIDLGPVKTYSDIDMQFLRHPINKDILRVENEDAIKQSIENLVMLNFYEKPFHPSLGGDIYRLLFENFDLPGTKEQLEMIIDSLIEKYEPRVSDAKTVAIVKPDRNDVSIKIYYKICNTLTPSNVEIFLKIIR